MIVSAVFIDLDETLIEGPFGPFVWPALLDELAAKTGLPRHDIYRAIVDENERRQRDPATPAVLAMDWDDIAHTIAAQQGVRLETDLTALCRAHAHQSRLLDNGAAVLRELVAPHRALVIATKGLLKYQQPILDALGLTPLVAAVLTPDTHSALKQDRRFFGDWPQQTRLQIMVGDRYDDDVQAPAGYGFKTVWKQPDAPAALHSQDPFARALLYPYAADQPTAADAIVLSLAELPEVVRRLELAALGFTA